MPLIEYKEAVGLVGQPMTCVNKVISIRHLALNPKFIGKIRIGVRETLHDQLNQYSEELGGVPIAFGKATCQQRIASVLDDSPYLHVDCNTEAVVFQPTEASKVLGVINKIASDHVSCLVHHIFNVAVFKGLQKNQEGQSNVDFATLSLGDAVVIEILKVQQFNRVISLRGKIIEKRDGSKETLGEVNLSGLKKENDSSSVGSLDSGLGALTPPLKDRARVSDPDHVDIASHKKKKKKKHKNRDESPKKSDELKLSANEQIIDPVETSDTVPNIVQDAPVRNVKKKKKKKQKTEEVDDILDNDGAQPESHSGAVVENDTNISLSSRAVLQNDSDITSSAKKKHKRKRVDSHVEESSSVVNTSSHKKKKKRKTEND